MSVRLYMEGGGDNNKDLATRCRKGFTQFLENSGQLKGRMPRVVVCGGRKRSYDDFCCAFAARLLDSLVKYTY